MSTVGGSWSSPKIVRDGLVLYLDANAPNSYSPYFAPTTWKDLSNNSNNGTLTNGPTYNSANGGSIVFDGVDDYVDIGIKSTLQPQSITLSVWFKIANNVPVGTLLRNRTYGWALTVSGSTASSNIYTSVSNQILATPSNISTGSYNNITLTYSNSTYYQYLNGTQTYTTSSATNSIYYVSNYVGIGRDANAASSFFTGNIGQVLIYNRALSATEILQNYNATKTRFGL
jgi:hypothetical protein